MEIFKPAQFEKYTKKIRDYLLNHNETVAVAESVTSGLVQLIISSIPDGAKFYQGGITAYNLGQKYRHLLVEPIHAQSCDCVSEQVAVQMAQNVCSLFSSDWGVAITGYATPVPESKKKVFAWFAISHKGKIVAKKCINSKVKEPFLVQVYFTKALLKELTLAIV